MHFRDLAEAPNRSIPRRPRQQRHQITTHGCAQPCCGARRTLRGRPTAAGRLRAVLPRHAGQAAGREAHVHGAPQTRAPHSQTRVSAVLCAPTSPRTWWEGEPTGRWRGSARHMAESHAAGRYTCFRKAGAPPRHGHRHNMGTMQSGCVGGVYRRRRASPAPATAACPTVGWPARACCTAARACAAMRWQDQHRYVD